MTVSEPILDDISTLASRSAPPRRGADLTNRHRPLALGLVGIAGALAAVSLLGPLATDVVDYRVSETLRNQLIGLDAVSLFLVAPVALAAAVLVLRGHVAGLPLALASGAYSAYMALQYVLGPDYAHIAGDNERIFPLVLFLFTGGWIVAFGAWNAVDVAQLSPLRPSDRLIGLIGLSVLAVPAFIRYVPALADWTSASPKDEIYLAGPGFGWAIALLDLGIFLPLTVSACVGLAGRRPWARKALYTAAGWFGLVGPAVAGMAISMYVNDDPNGSAANALFLSGLGMAFFVLATLVYRPLARRRDGAG